MKTNAWAVIAINVGIVASTVRQTKELAIFAFCSDESGNQAVEWDELTEMYDCVPVTVTTEE